MITHQSQYGQILKFNSEYYYSITDDKLQEIEENCANIDKDIIYIGGRNYQNELNDDNNELNDNLEE